ncbi:MAG: hypothetical protein L0154_01340 [Chloroflexi bacterium]|nr:hypothetical protein [Chloroflexota bacterium]
MTTSQSNDPQDEQRYDAKLIAELFDSITLSDLLQLQITRTGNTIKLEHTRSTGSGLDNDALIADMERSFERTDLVRDRIRQRFAERMSPISSVRKASQEIFRDFSLSRVQPDKRKEPTYFAEDDDLVKLQKTIMTEQLQQLKDSPPPKRGLRLLLKKEVLPDLGLNLENGNINGELNIEKTKGYISTRIRSAEVVSRRLPTAKCEIEAIADDLINEIVSGSQTDDQDSPLP